MKADLAEARRQSPEAIVAMSGADPDRQVPLGVAELWQRFTDVFLHAL
jgi:hypothetical protein